MLATVSSRSLMVRSAVACLSSAAEILIAASSRMAWIFFSRSAPIFSVVLPASKNVTRSFSFSRNRACSAARRRVVSYRARSRALTGDFLVELSAVDMLGSSSWPCGSV